MVGEPEYGGQRPPPAEEVGQIGARFGSPAMRRRMRAEAAKARQAEELAGTGNASRHRRTADPDAIGQTGARFGSPAVRRRLRAEAAEQPPPELPDPAALAEPAESGAPAEPAEPAERAQPPERRVSAEPRESPRPPAAAEPRESTVRPPAEVPEQDRDVSLVRPYAWTGGRTQSSYDLRLETLVSVRRHGIAPAAPAGSPKYWSIVEVCAVPRSVAEVAAALTVPLGVTRVLVGDLIDVGVLDVHETRGPAGGAQDRALLERVLAGLHRL